MSRRYMPVLHTLLSLPRYSLWLASDAAELNRGFVIREAIRLTCLVLIALTNRKFYIPPDQISFRYSLVTSLLTKNAVNWFPFLDLKLWVLVISGIVSEGEERSWYIAEISSVMEELGLSRTCEMMEVVRGIVWVEIPLEEEARRVVEDIQTSFDLGVGM
jgi:hypothetical protein